MCPTNFSKKCLWSEKTVKQSSFFYLKKKKKKTQAKLAHMDVLRRVTLFQDCDERILLEIAVSLTQQTYSPGDFICRKDEVGKCCAKN